MLKGVQYKGKYNGYDALPGEEHGIYTLDPLDPDLDALYVGQWRIDCDRLFHRHPVDRGWALGGGHGVQEYDVNDRVCWKCGTRCPDGIWMAHRLQQI
jgi:hypothetical protein